MMLRQNAGMHISIGCQGINVATKKPRKSVMATNYLVVSGTQTMDIIDSSL